MDNTGGRHEDESAEDDEDRDLSHGKSASEAAVDISELLAKTCSLFVRVTSTWGAHNSLQ